jgi:hypothetical protein
MRDQSLHIHREKQRSPKDDGGATVFASWGRWMAPFSSPLKYLINEKLAQKQGHNCGGLPMSKGSNLTLHFTCVSSFLNVKGTHSRVLGHTPGIPAMQVVGVGERGKMKASRLTPGKKSETST